MPVLEMQESKEIARLKARGEKLFNAIVKNGNLESTSSMRIGWNAFRLKAENLLGVLGFADEKAAIEASGVCEATWYANIAIAQAFKDVPEDVFCRMKQGNARQLVDLPESKRQDSYWLRLAETMSLKDFSVKIDEELNGKARASDGRERSAKLTIDMAASAKVSVEKGLREYAKSVGADSPAKALELMVTEYTGGVGLIEAITTAVARIKQIKGILHSGLSADEALIKIEEALDAMVLDFQASLNEASQKGSEAA